MRFEHFLGMRLRSCHLALSGADDLMGWLVTLHTIRAAHTQGTFSDTDFAKRVPRYMCSIPSFFLARVQSLKKLTLSYGLNRPVMFEGMGDEATKGFRRSHFEFAGYSFLLATKRKRGSMDDVARLAKKATRAKAKLHIDRTTFRYMKIVLEG